MATTTIAQFLEPSLWPVLLKKRREDSGVNQVPGICLVEATR